MRTAPTRQKIVRKHTTGLLEQRRTSVHGVVEALGVGRLGELLLELGDFGGLRVELALQRVALPRVRGDRVVALVDRLLDQLRHAQKPLRHADWFAELGYVAPVGAHRRWYETIFRCQRAAGAWPIPCYSVGVPAKPQPSPQPETRAWQLFNAVPWTPENRRMIAAAFLEDEGDIPAEVAHSFAMTAANAADAAAVDELVRTMRSQHFASLGKPVPDYAVKYR